MSRIQHTTLANNPWRAKAFTLIELLIVISIIALLLAIVVPVLKKAKQKAQILICCSNLSGIGKAIYAYAADHKDMIPFGPVANPMMPSDFYTGTGNVTSLLSRINDGEPIGLGLLVNSYLSAQPRVLFCPAADQPSEADKQLSLVGKDQAQCDYYYRHGSVALSAPDPLAPVHIRLGNLGKNQNGLPISALAMDVQFVAHQALEGFRIYTRTSHRQKVSNVLFADGRVTSQDNSDRAFTVNIGAYPYDSLEKILRVFEWADQKR